MRMEEKGKGMDIEAVVYRTILGGVPAGVDRAGAADADG